jgi:hypothetical protein
MNKKTREELLRLVNQWRSMADFYYRDAGMLPEVESLNRQIVQTRASSYAHLAKELEGVVNNQPAIAD